MMDPVTITIVAALTAGAAAGITKVTTRAIEDAYAGLRRLINDRYHKAMPFVEAVEADSASDAEQTVLAKQLEHVGAAKDEELKAAAQALLDAVAELRTKPEAAALFDFGVLHRARNVELEDIEALGTVFRAREATLRGDFRAKGIRQQPAGDRPEKY
jgi:hypothetical protein